MMYSRCPSRHHRAFNRHRGRGRGRHHSRRRPRTGGAIALRRPRGLHLQTLRSHLFPAAQRHATTRSPTIDPELGNRYRGHLCLFSLRSLPGWLPRLQTGIWFPSMHLAQRQRRAPKQLRRLSPSFTRLNASSQVHLRTCS